MKPSKIIRIIVAIILFLFSLMFLVIADSLQIKIFGEYILFLAIVISPISALITLAWNVRVSIIKTIIVEFILFVVALGFIGNKSLEYKQMIIYAILTIIIWILAVFINKKDRINLKSSNKIDEAAGNDAYSKIYNNLIKSHNHKVEETQKMNSLILNDLANLDYVSHYAIANITNRSFNTINGKLDSSIPRLDDNGMIMKICGDTKDIKNESELEAFFTREYYNRIIATYCNDLTCYIEKRIKSTLIQKESKNYRLIYNQCLNLLLENMDTLVTAKLVYLFSSDEDILKKNEYTIFNQLNYSYSNSFLYLIDLLATATCIAKIMFIYRLVDKLDKDSEFYKIVTNMSKELDDHQQVINKIYPLFKEFYRYSLGYIEKDINYSLAILMIYYDTNNKELSDFDKEVLNLKETKINTIEEYDKEIESWLLDVAHKFRNLDINKYIINKTINSISFNNYNLYFDVFKKLNHYSNIYNSDCEKWNKNDLKERYLKGDFSREKEENDGFSLGNVYSGADFEKYLKDLFEKYGYIVKHCGGAGDQGCDLLLYFNEYIYAVQAKFYTNKLDNTPIQEVLGAVKYYGADKGIVITNSSFTKGAEELAKASNVALIDGTNLYKLIKGIPDFGRPEDVLRQYR